MSDQMFVAGYVGKGTFVAFRRHRSAIEKMYKRGDRVIIEIYAPRSAAWEKKFFALVNTAWQNLPADIQENFPSPSDLRKWALIETGHFHERRGVFASNAKAQEFMMASRPADDYVLFSNNGAVLVERRPRSMRRDSMNREEFNKAADDVIACLAKLLGVSQSELESSQRGDKLSPTLAIAGPDAETSPSQGELAGHVAAPSKPGDGRLSPSPGGRHIKDETDPLSLSVDEALTILWDNTASRAQNGERPDVHNISLGGFAIGATWDREAAIARIQSARRLSLYPHHHSHQLLVIEPSGRKSIFENDPEATTRLVASRGLKGFER